VTASREDVAGFYEIALESRLVSIAAVVAWADGEIAAGDVPDEQVIDLALAADKPVDAVISILRRFRRGEYTNGSFKILGSILHQELHAGRRTSAATANLLYSIYSRAPNCVDVFGNQVRCIDEYFEPWMMAFVEADAEVRAMLVPFAGEELPPVTMLKIQ
jgi:hypothetical protein